MSRSRPISKRVFENIALLLLVVCLGLTAYWVATDSGLFRLAGAVVGKEWRDLTLFLSIFVTFIALFLVWLVIVLPLRAFSQVPPTPTNLAAIKQLYEAEAAQNEALYRTPPAQYTAEMKRRARFIGLVFVLLGMALATAVVLSLIVSLQTGYVVYRFQVLLAVLALMFLGAGLFQLVAGRSILRR